MNIESYISENPFTFLLIAILLIIIVSLVFIVYRQNRKYQDAVAPKFGFLGKPLMSFLAFTAIAGGFSVAIFLNNQTATVGDALAGVSIELEIDAAVINPVNRDYQFRVIPTANGIEWGPYSYDVYWTFVNADGTIITIPETDLSVDNIGGILRRMQIGVNTVKANVFVEDRVISKQIELTVN